MGETMELTQDRIEEIAREVYKSDRFTPTDQVWCNLHWLTLFAKAIERETSSERDREIERLTRDFDLLSTGMDLAGLQDQISASQAREREAREEARINLESSKAEAIDRDAMLSRAMQAEAREREAVADRESAIQKARVFTRENEILHDSLLKIERAYKDTESALTAARKALEKIAEAPGDNIGVWCRSTAIKALEFPEGHKPGCRYGELPTTFMDGGYPCTCGYRAALNGDSHA